MFTKCSFCLSGSLLNLAKHPSSTVQILGAEKALFRALKTKHDTPKYGLIYHASLVGQTNPKNKGKVSDTNQQIIFCHLFNVYSFKKGKMVYINILIW